MRGWMFACVALVGLPIHARADGLARIGNFEIRTEKDRFGDNDTAIASMVSGGNGFAIRCLRGELSIAFLEMSFGQGRWEEGMNAEVKIKVDNAPVVTTQGDGVNDKMIEVGGIDDTIRQMAALRKSRSGSQRATSHRIKSSP